LDLQDHLEELGQWCDRSRRRLGIGRGRGIRRGLGIRSGLRIRAWRGVGIVRLLLAVLITQAKVLDADTALVFVSIHAIVRRLPRDSLALI